jgi:hypothetical protein
MTAYQVTTPPIKQTTDQALAAAAAVAVALAQEQTRLTAAAVAVSTALQLQAESPAAQPWRLGTPLSPWQLIMRANQLAKKSRGSLR